MSKKYIERDIKHTLLIHHNPLNALFLDDLLEMFINKGWKLIDATDAFTDPIFKTETSIVPSGESIIWSVAKERGDSSLRYPAEDSVYEEKRMDLLGL